MKSPNNDAKVSSNGSVISSVSYGDQAPGSRTGHTWDGTHLWVTAAAPTGEDYLEKVSPGGSIAASFLAPNSPDAHYTAAAWDGSHLWLADSALAYRRIIEVDPTDMSVITSFSAPAFGLGGLTWDGTSLWCLCAPDRVVYRVSPSGTVLEAWSLPGVVAEAAPVGLAFDGQDFWVQTGLLGYGTVESPSFVPARIYRLAIPEPCTVGLVSAGALVSFAVLLGRRIRAHTWRSGSTAGGA